jgi:hypothetical protein
VATSENAIDWERPTITARLSKDGERVLCGRLANGRSTCRGDLAWTCLVLTGTTLRDRLDLLDQSEDPDVMIATEVKFTSRFGWSYGTDRVWRVGKYSRKYWQRQRREYSMVGQRRERDGFSLPLQPRTKFRRGRVSDQGFRMELPCRAECPECGLIQWLTSDLEAQTLERRKDTPWLPSTAMLTAENAPWPDIPKFVPGRQGLHLVRSVFVSWQQSQEPGMPRTWGAFRHEQLCQTGVDDPEYLEFVIGACERLIREKLGASLLDPQRAEKWLAWLGVAKQEVRRADDLLMITLRVQNLKAKVESNMLN